MPFETIKDYDIEKRISVDHGEGAQYLNAPECQGFTVRGVHYIVRSGDLRRASRHWTLPSDPNPFPIPDRVYRVVRYNESTRRATVVATTQRNVVEDVMFAYLHGSDED